MSDQNTSLPVRTESAGDVVAKIADATVPSQQLAVDASGKIIVKLDDAAGTGLTSQVNGSQQALDVGINVSGVQVDPRAIRALTSSDVVTVDQGTSPWVGKDQSDGPVAPGAVASFSSLAGGQYNIALPTLTDGQQAAVQVDASGRILLGKLEEDHNFGASGANTLRTAAEIGNATGAADFGTGAATGQTLRTTVSNLPNTADTNYGAVGSSTLRTAAEVGNASGAADFNNGATGAQTLRVAANLAVAGADVSGTNPVPVTIEDAPGSHINDYKKASAIAGGGTDNHDYTVTALKTLHLNQIEASASGKAKIELMIETGVATGVFNSKFVQFNSTATPNMSIHLDDDILVAAGVRVRLAVSNRDNQAEDLYSTVSGFEL